MISVQKLIDILEEIAPSQLSESWDNTGLLIGDAEAEACGVLIALDPTLPLLAEAVSLGINVVITHHPAIFHPLKSLCNNNPTGRFIHFAIKNNLHIISCHTNLDAAPEGVSDIFAVKLDLTDIIPLIPSPCNRSDSGTGRIGNYRRPLSPVECIEKIYQVTDAPWLMEAGPRPERVQTIALCGGSGSEFAETARAGGADLFITAEIKHSVARWAEETGFWLIDGGHFSTEQLIIDQLHKKISSELTRCGCDLVVKAVKQSPPLNIIKQS
jgi:dinuclear metal center YbgI/SA1388 family protein